MWLRAMRGAVERGRDGRGGGASSRERLASAGTLHAQGDRRARRQGRAPASASGCGSTSCACRRRAPGSAAARTSSPWREDWVGAPPPTDATTRPSTHLVRRYLAGFGPASRDDVVSYTGLGQERARARARAPAPAALSQRRPATSCSTSRARRCPIPTRRRPCATCRRGTRRCSSTPAARACCPSATARRSSTSKNPHSLPTFLVDGAVAGTWRHRDGQIELEPFEPPLDAAALRDAARGGRPAGRLLRLSVSEARAGTARAPTPGRAARGGRSARRPGRSRPCAGSAAGRARPDTTRCAARSAR